MKKLLIVVDYQKDFVDGSLGFAGAELLDAPIAAKIAAYRAAGDDVAFTFDTHTPDYLSTQEGRKLPLAHCIRGSEGWALYGATARAACEGDRCFEKPTFPSLALGEWLKDRTTGRSSWWGWCPISACCPMPSSPRPPCPRRKLWVDASCTASADPVLHQKCLDVLEGLQVTVTNRT